MNSRTDQELLRDYAESSSEAAFSELLRRYVDLVYSTALRMVRDKHLAEDVSQGVFVALARNAGCLADGAVLSNWLHRTAHHISANTVRTDVRRRSREKIAVMMNEILSAGSDPSWELIAPQFDEALRELGDPDRDALLLRYFQRKSAREMGATLGISSEAAQKRVNRAIERLRDLFAKRGIAIGASGLTALMATNAVEAAPPELAACLSRIAVGGASCHTSTAITAAKLIAMTTFQKTLITATILAAIAVGWHELRHDTHVQRLTRAAQALPPLDRPKEAPKPDLDPTFKRIPGANSTPAPRQLQMALAKPSAARPFTSTQMYQLLKTKAPSLTRAQVEPYLKAKGRSAPALLAGYRTTGDPSLLAEAIEKYPTDAQVAFEAANRSGISAEESQRWLDVLKQAAPDNSLANYLSADSHFKAGQTAEAIQDLTTASASQQFQNYSTERIQANEEAYLAAGYSPGEAELLANNFLATPYLLQLKELGPELVALAATYQSAGDQTSRDAALQTAVNLGRRLTEPTASEPLAAQLIGINIERTALDAMDPALAFGDGQTVQQRMDQLAQQKEAIHVLTSQADPLWGTLSDQDWVNYHAQLSVSGEEKALQWLVSNYGPR